MVKSLAFFMASCFIILHGFITYDSLAQASVCCKLLPPCLSTQSLYPSMRWCPSKALLWETGTAGRRSSQHCVKSSVWGFRLGLVMVGQVLVSLVAVIDPLGSLRQQEESMWTGAGFETLHLAELSKFPLPKSLTADAHDPMAASHEIHCCVHA